ncbi:Prolipoprotein diacylglyceryl transferase [Poriferisphaera corsica]|uniref:Phosphatidylglycerol--prolipoprotein diacylglyceryl transferase n=1 Tax=Poriferisphaera corsica TaxID=2528020 RepID=A0A517YYS5_9BACT|nr:prolipoprotein diacylglyceryl transferase [Poriferisphaera corsica]QDU35378.1 Prolipoprotein diacylglyceryl transferase [Poriferisphaera corsica]
MVSILLAQTSPYVHQISPFLVYPIRWYGLSYLAGIFAAWLLIRRICKVGKGTMKPEAVTDFIVFVALGMMIGGRLGYCIFYDRSLWGFTEEFPYWGVLAINNGGMASHGGIVGAIIGAWWYGRKHQQPLLFLVDLLAVSGPIGIFFGRIANFINGELYGRAVKDPNFALGVKFPTEITNWYYSQPEKYEALIAKLPSPTKFGYIQEYWTPDRIIEQTQKHNQVIIDAIAPLLTTRHPSQIYQALLEGLALFVIMFVIYRKPRKPGIVTFSFFIFYAIFRILAEFYRNPDVQIGYEAFGLTRGQWLSVPVIAVGIVGILWAKSRNVEALGGWQKLPELDAEAMQQ